MKGELKNIGGNFYKDIEKIAEKCIKKFKKDVANRTGKLLHKLAKDKPEKEMLKKLINQFPSSLLYKNDNEQLPIHSAVWYESVGYLSLLAEQGIKYNVGGDNKRGGLLLEDPADKNNRNVLQLLVLLTNDRNPISCDTTYLNTMKDLRAKNLLVKNDIKDHDLLYWACEPTNKLRFDYLADWSLDGLKTYTHTGVPIFHSIINHRPIILGIFRTFLEASLRRHPQDAGLLFQKDRHDKTTCEYAFDKYGKEETFNILTDLIPPDAPQFPILHHVAKHVPRYMNDFAMSYPSSIYTLDSFGCTISEDESQGRNLAGNSTHTGTYRINGIKMIGPDRVGLYPFMVAASGNTSDHLFAVYCLLRRDPSLVNGGKRIDQSKNRKRKRRRRDEGVIKIKQDE